MAAAGAVASVAVCLVWVVTVPRVRTIFSIEFSVVHGNHLSFQSPLFPPFTLSSLFLFVFVFVLPSINIWMVWFFPLAFVLVEWQERT